MGNFQIKAWQALLKIPERVIVSNSDAANLAGRPDAVRAAVDALGSNPVAWLIPRRRALRSSGEIVGCRRGTARKQIILTDEPAGSTAKRSSMGVMGKE